MHRPTDVENIKQSQDQPPLRFMCIQLVKTMELNMVTLLTNMRTHTHTHTHTQSFVGRLLPNWLINRVAWQMMQYGRDKYLKKKAKKS